MQNHLPRAVRQFSISPFSSKSSTLFMSCLLYLVYFWKTKWWKEQCSPCSVSALFCPHCCSRGLFVGHPSPFLRTAQCKKQCYCTPGTADGVSTRNGTLAGWKGSLPIAWSRGGQLTGPEPVTLCDSPLSSRNWLRNKTTLGSSHCLALWSQPSWDFRFFNSLHDIAHLYYRKNS